MRPGDVSLIVVPMFHITGMVMNLLGTPGLERFNPGSLRSMGGGGATMPKAIATRLRAQFNLPPAG